ncbi:MAG: ABC transporter permease [Deltaproteobacteria bacterium]|nr:MAG: ABC transporter permease [Deltaproteobacteria bacterium]
MKTLWLGWLPPRISWIASWRVWQRNATVYRRTFQYNILPNFFEPIFYLASLGLGLAMHIKQMEGMPYVPFIASGLLASQAMMGASFEVTYNVFVKMTFAKTYDAILTTPVHIEDIAMGEILWAVTRSLIYAVVFLLVIGLWGLVHTPWALLAIPAAMLVGALFAGIGLTFTALVPNIDMYSFYFTLFLTPLFLFSGIFFSLQDMPSWVQTVAWLTPLFHGVELMRALVLRGPNLTTLLHVACLAGAAFFFCSLSIRLFCRRMLK